MVLTEYQPPFFTKTSFIQLGYGIYVSMAQLSVGFAFGFPAVALPQMNVTKSEQGWIASSISLSSPLGCMLSGYLSDTWGRKISIVFSQLPLLIGWIYTSLSANAMGIIIGRFIAGIGFGMAVTVPKVIIAEISLPNIRGVLSPFPNIAQSIGITIQAYLGAHYAWTKLCYFNAIFAIFLMFSFTFLPETPYYLILKGEESKAEVSLKKFRSKGYDIGYEMKSMRDYRKYNGIHSLSFCEQFKTLSKKSVRKPFGIIVSFYIIGQLSGITVLTMYCVSILKQSGTNVSPHLGNILMGAQRIFGAVLCSVLMYSVRRRKLAITSGLGLGTTFIIMGIYTKYSVYRDPFPLICVLLYTMAASIGFNGLPSSIMNELYPLQVRGILGGVTQSIYHLAMFCVCNAYPNVSHLVGFSETIFIFGINALLGCIFLYYCLPETKDRTLREIEEFFKQSRSQIVRNKTEVEDGGRPKEDDGKPRDRTRLDSKGRVRFPDGIEGETLGQKTPEELVVLLNEYETEAKQEKLAKEIIAEVQRRASKERDNTSIDDAAGSTNKDKKN